MKVKPTTAGAIIRDPHTKQPLPAEGGDVPDSNFWRRRLLAGDVELVEERATPTGLEPVAPLITRGDK